MQPFLNSRFHVRQRGARPTDAVSPYVGQAGDADRSPGKLSGYKMAEVLTILTEKKRGGYHLHNYAISHRTRFKTF